MRFTPLKHHLLILLLTIASWALYYTLGVRFDSGPLLQAMQFIEADLLNEDLARSLLYYHSNPPLLNVLAGFGLKLFGEQADIFWSLVLYGCGLATIYSVFWLVLRFTASLGLAYACALLLMFNPTFILYQNWLFYTMPALALLTVSCVLLFKMLDTRTMFWAGCFFTCLATLALTRSLFHLAWILLVLGLLLIVMKNFRRQLIVCSAIPLLVCTLWYGKNQVLFNSFSASSLMGLGLSNISSLLIPHEKLVPLVESGELSPYVLVSRYANPEVLFDSGAPANTGIPVLDRKAKANGFWNFNYLQIAVTGRIYVSDGLKVIRHFPRQYLTGLWVSNQIFFSSNSMNIYFSEENRQAVAPAMTVYDLVVYGAGRELTDIDIPAGEHNNRIAHESKPAFILIFIWLALIPFVITKLWQACTKPEIDHETIVLGFIAMTTAYVYGLGTMIELAENFRYRFLTESLFWVTAFYAGHELWKKFGSSPGRPDVSTA